MRSVIIRICLLVVACLWAPPVCALTKEQALRILAEQVLRPSETAQNITAHLLPEPLSGGMVEPGFGGPPFINIAEISGNRQWVAFVDLFPCELMEHDVIYVFIDDLTGAVTRFDASDWPAIDGELMGASGASGSRPIILFPQVPRPFAISPVETTTEPVGDYGDAPDGQLAYIGVIGRFPTRFATENSPFGRPGAHALTVGLEYLGRRVSAERDVLDPNDPDERTNLRDADDDERVFIAWDPNTSPATAHVIYDVTVSGDAPATDRYVNVLLDFNRDGLWAGAEAGREWAVRNQPVTVASGMTATLITPAFPWGTEDTIPTQLWMRIALARTPIEPSLFGDAGWDGSGAFAFGEIEDFETYLRICPAEPPEPPADNAIIDPLPPPAAPPPPGIPVPPTDPNPLAPGPRTGWDSSPIQYFALVIQGNDNPNDTFIKEDADQMQTLLQAQGWTTTRINGADEKAMTEAKIQEWLTDVLTRVKCQDKILIYLTAHGRKAGNAGVARMFGAGARNGQVNDDETLDDDELSMLLDQIQPCDGKERCDTVGKSCDVTVIIHTCYAGKWQGKVADDPMGRPKKGRRTIMSSAAGSVSRRGVDGSGSEYSDRYIECAQNPAVDRPGNGNRDGFADPTEIHKWAAPRLQRRPAENPQGPFIRGGPVKPCCSCPADQCHFENLQPNPVQVGVEASAVAVVSLEFQGSVNAEVILTRRGGDFVFTSGDLSEDESETIVATDERGRATVFLVGLAAGPALIQATVAGNNVRAYLFFMIVDR